MGKSNVSFPDEKRAVEYLSRVVMITPNSFRIDLPEFAIKVTYLDSQDCY